MTAEMPPDGAWVEVVLRGQAAHDGFRPKSFYVGANVITPSHEHVVSVTVIDPPEPTWEPGAVVKDSEGVVWVRRHHERPWIEVGCRFEGHGEDGPIRPLTRLVPEER